METWSIQRVFCAGGLCCALLAGGGCVGGGALLAVPDEEMTPTQEARYKRARSLYTGVTPLVVRGRMLDQYDDPVPHARLKMYWETPSLVEHERWVETDEQGNWEWRKRRVLRTGIEEVQKDGYEFLPSQKGERSEDFATEWIETGKIEPVVLYLRKKGETTFLLHSGKIVFLKAPFESKTFWHDLVLAEQFDSDPLQLTTWRYRNRT